MQKKGCFACFSQKSEKASCNQRIKGIVSQDFGTLFWFHWIDFKVVIGPDRVYFSF
jgi:hypothetical protein